jgi:penicillin V acylase-like amidase (Ntn superfamily)
MKNIKALASLLTAGSLIFSCVGNAIACTALVVTDIHGNAYQGRTMEFSALIPTALTYLPAGTLVESLTPDDKTGMTFNTKYPVLGMTLQAVPNAKQVTLTEGANDQGLTFSANILTNSTAAPVGADASKILSGADLGMWIVGNFKSVAELKAALSSNNPQVWLPPIPMLGNLLLPTHYAIYDKTGAALVIEYQNSKQNVYDNPVGVLTNGPEFPWHLTNLNNYTQTNVDNNIGKLGKLRLKTQDAGIALSALPSAETATGRFVKAAFYANYVRKAKTPDEAIVTLGHIMNNFDRPYDLTVDGGGGAGDGPRINSLSSEVSDWIIMNDLSRHLFYVRSINSLNWSVVDITKLSGLKQIKSISTYDVDRSGADLFTLFAK